MHQLINKKNNIIAYLLLLILLSTTSNKTLESTSNFPFKVNKIDVSGLSERKNFKIANELNQFLSNNILFINKDNINRIVYDYNLVEKYTAKKIYPSKISIEIEPTKFIAEINGDIPSLVGFNGKLIFDENTNEILPVVSGEFNSQRFIKLRNDIEKSKFKFTDFKSIIFYSSDRWDILTVNDVLIKLPKKNVRKALEIVEKIIKNEKFKANRVIDLRISNYIITKNE